MSWSASPLRVIVTTPRRRYHYALPSSTELFTPAPAHWSRSVLSQRQGVANNISVCRVCAAHRQAPRGTGTGGRNRTVVYGLNAYAVQRIVRSSRRCSALSYPGILHVFPCCHLALLSTLLVWQDHRSLPHRGLGCFVSGLPKTHPNCHVHKTSSWLLALSMIAAHAVHGEQ